MRLSLRPRRPAHASAAQLHRQRWLVVAPGAVIVLGLAVAIGRWQLGPPTATRAPAPSRSSPSQAAPGAASQATPEGPPSSPARWWLATSTPTAQAPMRILEVGDSLGMDLGAALQSDLDGSGVVSVTMDAQGDTGLANEGYYDWPTALTGDLASAQPQIVIVLLGANDAQGFVVDGTAQAFGTPAWQSTYAQRIDAVLQESGQVHARVVWVGAPAMEDPTLSAQMQLLDGLYAREVAKCPWALYLPSDPVLAPDGQFTFTGTTPSGQTLTTRTPDGVHLTSAGAQLLAQAAVAAMDHRWGMHLAA